MRARDNPFRTERLLQVRYHLAGATWEQLLDRCEHLRFRAAIVGPHGAGKTTFLEELQRRLAQRGWHTRWIRLDAEQPGLKPGALTALLSESGPRDILLLDGAEQLGPLTWRWLRWRTRSLAGLIVTTHRPGRLPTLWRCQTSPELLARVAGELLGLPPERLQGQAEVLFPKHAGNLREALRDWYDAVATTETTSAEVPAR